MTREVRVSLDATPDGARAAAEWARTVLTGYAPGDALACELAVAEAVNNVVVHETAAASFAVVLRVGNGRFSAALTHAGAGAQGGAPMPDPSEPGGRGLALIDRCMEHVQRRTTGAETSLVMSRRITPSPAGAHRDGGPSATTLETR